MTDIEQKSEGKNSRMRNQATERDEEKVAGEERPFLLFLNQSQTDYLVVQDLIDATERYV